MKRKLILLILIFGSAQIYAQQDSTVNLDVLKAPASAAFNLMGFTPSAIERPSDVNAFALSLQNSTKDFTALANSFAVEFAPSYLTRNKSVSLGDMQSSNFKDVFRQSFTFSLAYTHLGPEGQEDIDSLRQSKMGFGLKFSLIRPKFSTRTKYTYDDLIKKQKEMLNFAVKSEDNNPFSEDIKKIEDALEELPKTVPNQIERKKMRDALIASLRILNLNVNTKINEEIKLTEAFNEAKQIASDFKIERTGPFLDFAAGIVLDFPDDRFNNSRVTKGGAWLTGGYENGNKGISSLFIIRYLYQPDKIFADDNNILKSDNLSTFDAGGRLILTGAKGKLNLSAETIYRSALKSNAIDPSWRVVFNTEYDIGANKKLTFAFGRNFDGAINKGGNLIAALNFFSSFGSARKISN